MEISFKKYLLSAAIGFGIGGIIWGGILYRGTLSLTEVFTNPFSYILGAFIIGFAGSISLSLFLKNIKKILIITLLGIIGCLIGFIGAGAFSYYLYLYGSTFLRIFIRFFGFFNENIENSINLKPSLVVGDLWASFIIAGIFIGLFFAVALKTKIWPIVWRGGIGFGFGSLIGPLIGNVLGFDSLLASYLITFSVIGIVLGLFLAWGVYYNIRRSNLL